MAGREYQMAFTIGAKLQGQFGAAFKGAQNSVQGLQNQIQALNKRQGDISSYQKTQQAIEKTTQRLERYKAQYAALQAEIQKNGTATDAQMTKEAQLGNQINNTQDKLNGYQQKLDATGKSLAEAGVDTNNLAAESQQLGQEIEQLKGQQEELASANQNVVASLAEMAGALGIAEAIKKAGEALKACAEAAMEYESAMAGVKRTVGGSDEFLAQMGADFKQMSTQIPITANELAQIATTAGQLGVAQENVKSFTETMARLATATDLTADEAATMLAQFSNITGVKDFERIGAVVAELGDATATTASKVVQMSQGMAASANIAGMSANDIMAIAAAVGSLGIEAQAGSTAMSTLINTLFKATETGDKLQEFASVAGMSAEEFKQAWASDAVGAMNAFITGLNDVERNGRSAIVILDELGINNVRQTKAILGLASAGDLLSTTIAKANAAWESNTALTDKAGIMYQTAEAKVTMMQNAFTNVKTAIGEAFTPAIAAGAEALTGLMQPVAEFIEANPQLVQAFTAAAGAIGVIAGSLALYTAGAKAAALAHSALIAVMGGPALKTIMLVTAGVAALAAVIAGLSGIHAEAQVTMSDLTAEFTDLSEQIEEQQKIIDLADKYKKLTTEIDNTVKVSRDLEFKDIDITVGATAEQSIEPDQFLVDGDDNVEIYGDAQESIDADNLLDADGNIVLISGEEDTGSIGVDADDLLDADGNVVLISGEEDTSTTGVDADRLLDADGNVVGIIGEPAPDKTLTGDELLADDKAHITGVAAEEQNVSGDELVGDNIVYLHGRKATDGTDMNASDFVPDPNVDIYGRVGQTDESLTGENFVDDNGVDLVGRSAAEQTVTGDNLIADPNAEITGIAAEDQTLTGDKLIADNTVAIEGKAPENKTLTGEDFLVDQDAYLYGKAAENQDLTGDKLIADPNAEITGIAAGDQTLTGDDLIADTNAEVTGTAAESQSLTGDKLLADKNAEVTGTAAEHQTLTGAELLADDTATVKGKAPALKTLKGDDFVGEKGVHLYAANPESEAKLDANVFVNGTELHFTAQFDNYSDMLAQVEHLKSQASSVKQELSDAKEALEAEYEQRDFLRNRLKYATTDSQKSSIQSELNTVTEAIEAQRNKVNQLQTAYENLGAEYLITKSAADTWSQKQQEAAAIEEQLGAAASATAEGYAAQIEARKTLAEYEQKELKQKALNNLQQQAQLYASAYSDYVRNTEKLASIQTELDNLSTPENLAARISSTYKQIGDALAEGSDWDSKKVKDLRQLFETQMSEANGGAWKVSYANYGAMSAAMQSMTIGTEEVTGAQTDLTNQMREADAAAADASATMQEYINGAIDAINNGTVTEEEARSTMETAFSGYENGAQMVEDAMAQVAAATAEAAKEAENYNNTVDPELDKQIAQVINEQTAELQQLAEAYQNAYEEAYKSMDGQFKLFEKMDQVTASEDPAQAVQEMLDALISQQQYIADYQANLQAVNEMGLDPAIISQLSDGSKESAKILADLAKTGAEKIEAINIAFEGVKKGKEEFATQVAEIETNFEATMNTISEKVNTAVGEMNKAGEAASAGAATGQAFADALAAKNSIVSSAGQKLGEAALEGLKKGFANLNIPGFATGTTNAPPGAALVGENGPEIMLFRGGEQIIDAEHTRDIMSRSNGAETALSSAGGDTHRILEFKPTYNISGSNNPDDLQRVLDEHDERLRETIENLIDEIENDNGRRRYA